MKTLVAIIIIVLAHHGIYAEELKEIIEIQQLSSYVEKEIGDGKYFEIRLIFTNNYHSSESLPWEYTFYGDINIKDGKLYKVAITKKTDFDYTTTYEYLYYTDGELARCIITKEYKALNMYGEITIYFKLNEVVRVVYHNRDIKTNKNVDRQIEQNDITEHDKEVGREFHGKAQYLKETYEKAVPIRNWLEM